MHAPIALVIRLGFTTSVVLMAALAPRCQASWAYVPQEIRIMQADLVVVGTITRTAMAIKKDGRTYAVGVIKPTMILKGKPKMNQEIRVAWPAPRAGGLSVSTDIIYRVGQKGIWVLTADKTLPVFWANYPTDYQALGKLAEVRKKLANLKNIQWGKASNGLQVGLIVEQLDVRKSKSVVDGKPVKAISQLSIYPVLKNISDKPMQVVDHFQDRPISIALSGPDGQPIDVKIYGDAPKQAVDPKTYNFRAVLPGRVSTVGYGYRLPLCIRAGEYTITLRYQNDRDGVPLKIDNVWQGQAESRAVKVAVPAKAEVK